MYISLFALFALLVTAFAAPSINHVLHEKRDGIPQGWRKLGKLSGAEVLSMSVALTQGNLDRAEEFLMEVSHPNSPKYGQHWSAKDIADTFAPRPETVEVVTAWLEAAGISPERIHQSQSLGWLKFDATVNEAQNLLKAEYHRYQHSSGKPHVACTEYHIPAHVRPHVDFITPTVHFAVKVSRPKDAYPRKIKRTEPKAAIGVKVKPNKALHIGSPNSGSTPKAGVQLNVSSLVDGLNTCDTYITPDCVRALYQFPPGVTANPQNSFGIVEYTPQIYLQTDLDLFFSNFSRNQAQRTPILDSIDGGEAGNVTTGFSLNAESDLDLEYGMSLVNPQKTTLYQVGDNVEGASFNDFLDAIDGSYCTFDGGDDKLQDAKYPDPRGGYGGPKNCGGFSATKVISSSYAYNEADLTARYEVRQCTEYAKLGLAGTTVIYSSGDYGVAGNKGQCITPIGKTLNDGSSGIFNPAFPATCPYVTTVGATQIKPGASLTAPETAIQTRVLSGGGFSNVFGLPSYQTSAVKSWFANNPPPYGADRFNNSQATRGYPDLSANGANYVVAVNGEFSLVYGTSASTPVVGAIITLINEIRINSGKNSVGFINPVLYENPDAFTDVTSGTNPGCGTAGFTAATGWDPITGLGTPNYPSLLNKFLALS